MNRKEKTAILLLNLGGPEKQDDVEPFLYNLFSDRDIIQLGPVFLQKPIARFIAKRRAPKSKKNYALIGGGSPIARITAKQGQALEKALAPHGNFWVRMCMRYWQPNAARVVEELKENGFRHIIALPLYPHYSKATTGSSFADLARAVKKISPNIQITRINSWPEQRDYVACLAQRINKVISQFNSSDVQVVYSAHSLPKKFIDEGDPYVDELKQTIKAVEVITKHSGLLCYQSRSGPVEWLAPSTPDTLIKLSSQGCKKIVMVPLSFVSDHVETLFEIDILYKEQAAGLGMDLRSTPGLNDDPLFIESLKNIVLTNI